MFVHESILRVVELFSDITPLLPYYHVVSNERLAHIRHLHPYKNERQFVNDIDFLCKRYQPVALNDLVDYARQGKKLRKGSFIVTFDDGYSQIDSVVAPILFQKGIPAIFFLTSDFIDNKRLGYRNKASIIVEHLLGDPRALSGMESGIFRRLNVTSDHLPARLLTMKYEDAGILDEVAERIGVDFAEFLRVERPYLASSQIRNLIDRGFYFGAHSLDHPYFPDLSPQEQIRQTSESVRWIKSEFGLAYSLFAFPHSDHAIDEGFFRSIENVIDLTFGTCGIKRDPIGTNLQRINFERTLRPAADILARQLIKKIVHGRSKDGTLNRSNSL